MIRAVFLCEGVRTPIGRFAGALATVRPDDLAAHVLRTLVERLPGLDPAAIDDVIMGCANQAGEDNRDVARMAVLLAGLPVTVPGTTVNRLCGSGLDALSMATRAIASGECELMVAGGVESMSRAPFVMPKSTSAFSRSNAVFDTTIGWRFVNTLLERQYGVESMPETAENVAAQYKISREDQDKFALRSQERAAAAQAAGRFAQEIAPVPVPRRKAEPLWVEHDEHLRATTLEKLSGLATPFRDNGSVTAGNASGVNDGAAALIVASEEAVKRHGLSPRARLLGSAVAGVEPRIMGMGPVPASRKLMARLGMRIEQFGVIELNEAFAAQGLACMRELGLEHDAAHVNANGGAIALGHPLGMTGARLALTASLELQSGDAQHALCTLCVGVGQGMALALARV